MPPPPGPVKLVIKKMAVKGGCIDFMFLPPGSVFWYNTQFLVKHTISAKQAHPRSFVSDGERKLPCIDVNIFEAITSNCR